MGEREAEEPSLYLKADEGRRLRGRPVRPRAVMAETAQLTETAVFTAAGRPVELGLYLAE